MARLFLGVILVCMHSTPLSALTFDHYHSQDEINAYMSAKGVESPDLVEIKTLGRSRQGREIRYAIIHPRDGQHRETIFINGTHHGNEKSSTEAVLGLMEHLIQHQNDPFVATILNKYALYILPIVNPDGHAADSRTDSQGIDINRDYPYPRRGAQDSFKSESTQLIQQLAEKARFYAAIAYHAGMEAVLWPTCYSDTPPIDRALFRALSQKVAERMGFRRYLQSYLDYPTEGEFIDFVYSTYGTLAITLEVSEDPRPPSAHLAPIVARSIRGALAYLEGLNAFSLGQLSLDDNNPLPFDRPTSPFAGSGLASKRPTAHH